MAGNVRPFGQISVYIGETHVSVVAQRGAIEGVD